MEYHKYEGVYLNAQAVELLEQAAEIIGNRDLENWEVHAVVILEEALANVAEIGGRDDEELDISAAIDYLDSRKMKNIDKLPPKLRAVALNLEED